MREIDVYKRELIRCKECGDEIVGRVDKIFCCDECRTAFHNRNYREENKKFQEINSILRKNYKILNSILATGKVKCTYDYLAKMGFNFKYFTSYKRASFSRGIEHSCYDISYNISFNGEVSLVKALAKL